MIQDNIINNTSTDLITYSIAEAAVKIGVTKDAVYRLVRTGKLPHVKVGSTRILHDTLVRFLRDSETTHYWDVEVAC